MPTIKAFTDLTGSPSPLDGVYKLLILGPLGFVLGVAIGTVFARGLRRRHLHWSWALVALPPLLLLGPSIGVGTSTIGVAAIWASWKGCRWHREDGESGLDLAEIAAARVRPLDLLRSCASPRASGSPAEREVELAARRGEVPLGRDERGRILSIPLAGSAGRHTLVVGATGSGKTVTQTWLLLRAIERGEGAIVVDPKGDRTMLTRVRAAADAAGREFLLWTPTGPAVYNPYARGSETEIADKLLAGEPFSEPHYLRQAQRYLGHEVRILRIAGAEISLRSVVDHLDPGTLDLLTRDVDAVAAEATQAYLDGLSARQLADLSGVRDRLAIMAESDVGPWLDPGTSGKPRFDLLGAVHKGAVVYFALEADTRPLIARMLGVAIVQDLLTTVGALQGAPVPTTVAIDEFSAVAAEQVVRLFARARSAGFSLLLGTQELSDLRLPGRERLIDQVMGNLPLLIAHRQVVPASAEMIAAVAGTRGAWKVSRHSDGRSTRTRTRERVLDPGRVMTLAPGWAAVIVLAGTAGARIAQIFPPDRGL